MTQTTDSNSHQVPADLSKIFLHYLTLRRTLGAMGLALPVILMLEAVHTGAIRTSISAYYYSGLRDIFVGSLMTIGVFLLCYRGNNAREGHCSTFAGVGAIGTALLPTFPPVGDPTPWLHWLHYASAALFFTMVAWLSWAIFTKTTDTAELNHWITPRDKQRRNFRYRLYAGIMAVCLLFIAGDKVIGFGADTWSGIFWAETIAVWAFALSWLLKGEALRGLKEVFS